jgi:hypothetical protein
MMEWLVAQYGFKKVTKLEELLFLVLHLMVLPVPHLEVPLPALQPRVVLLQELFLQLEVLLEE